MGAYRRVPRSWALLFGFLREDRQSAPPSIVAIRIPLPAPLRLNSPRAPPADPRVLTSAAASAATPNTHPATAATVPKLGSKCMLKQTLSTHATIPPPHAPPWPLTAAAGSQSPSGPLYGDRAGALLAFTPPRVCGVTHRTRN